MARIAILNAGHMAYGGTERVVSFQARGLSKKGHSVSIFTPVNDPAIFAEVIPKETPIKTWWYAIPTPILKRTINRLLHFWFGGTALKNFDIVIAHNQPAPYVSYKNKKKNHKPYIVYCHAPWRRLYPRKIDLVSGWASDYREKIMFLRKNYWRTIDMESLLNANVVLVNSEKIREEVKNIYGINSRLCYPGIDIEKYENHPRNSVKEIVEKYHLDDHTLLVVGRHAPQKMLEWVPEILKKVLLRVSDVKVVVTGTPNKFVTSKLIEKTKKLNLENNIKIIGAVSDPVLISLYLACPILMYTAVHEDFGLPPVEAMSCECVPVAWNEDAGPCETILDGQTGLLANPYILEDFAEKVLYLLEHPDERALMAKKGKVSIAKFDWSSHINILDEVIHDNLD